GLQPPDVLRNPDGAVRVVTPQVREDELLGHTRRIVFGYAPCCEDVSSDPLQRVRFDHRHIASRLLADLTLATPLARLLSGLSEGEPEKIRLQMAARTDAAR